MAAIYLRGATSADVPAIMLIIDAAKALLKADGSPQWQDGHPDGAMIQHDIDDQAGWVLMVGGVIGGYAALTTDGEPNYAQLTGGQWQDDRAPYGVIHRVAIANQFRGMHLSKTIFTTILSVGVQQGLQNFRIDTHAANQRMQHLVTSVGFEHRGQVMVEDQLDPRREAFELNL